MPGNLDLAASLFEAIAVPGLGLLVLLPPGLRQFPYDPIFFQVFVRHVVGYVIHIPAIGYVRGVSGAAFSFGH